jgi:hypothetical protein
VRSKLSWCVAWTIASCAQPRLEAPARLRVAVVGPLERLSANNNLGSYSRLAQDWVYEPLARVMNDGTLEPALAASLDHTGNELRLHLRRDARFSDGSLVTMGDVDRSLTRANLKFKIDGDTVIVPSSSENVLPFALIWKASADAEIGTGAFRVTHEEPGKIVLHRLVSAPERIEMVELDAYETPREALARTLKGDADLLPRVEPRMAEFFDNVQRLRLVHGDSIQAASIGFSLRLTAKERRGLASSLPTAELARTAFGESCKPWNGPGITSATFTIRKKLDVLVPLLDVGYERMGLAVRRSLGARGGNLRVKGLSEMVKAIVSRDVDLFIVPILVWPPAAIGSIFHSGSVNNIFGYSDANVDRALDAGDWNQALKALAENPPALFVCRQERLIAVDSRVKNPRIGASASLEFLPEWEFKE